ncbi:hypothetical protein VUR80DRAFT_621 [Thermomyces stellatus]
MFTTAAARRHDEPLNLLRLATACLHSEDTRIGVLGEAATDNVARRTTADNNTCELLPPDPIDRSHGEVALHGLPRQLRQRTQLVGSTLRPVTYKAAERTLGTIITEHKWIDEVPAFASEDCFVGNVTQDLSETTDSKLRIKAFAMLSAIDKGLESRMENATEARLPKFREMESPSREVRLPKISGYGLDGC